MKEITIRAELTLKEYSACQDALRYGKAWPIVFWALLVVGTGALASSAALVWGTPASMLAGLALITLACSVTLSSQITANRRQEAYKRYRDSKTSYTLTTDRIVATSRHTQIFLAWPAIDRVIKTKTGYLLTAGERFICIPKRDIPLQTLADFIELLQTHRLLKET